MMRMIRWKEVKVFSTFLLAGLASAVFGPEVALAQNNASAGAAGAVIKSKEYPTGYFRSPLGIPSQASGTFGELRSTHFHAGDDFRTQQRVGLPLFAVAEGYISRVRVQIGGGGNSVYITHPNGYTTAYLHMHEFTPAVAAKVRQAQYRDQRFDVDLEFGPQDFPLAKGDRIGLAGNSGSSEGPHLHFEIRETETQEPINPQLFGLHFPDKTPPLIHGITLYDLGDGVFNENTPRRQLKLVNKGAGRYQVEQGAPLPVNGRFGLGINTVDRHDGTTFNNGVYSIELIADEKPVSTVVFERLSFTTSGSIHAYIDYPHYVRTRIRVQKSFKDPNNPINIFHHLDGDGSMTLTEQQRSTLTYRVRDVHGNTSLVSFTVQNDPGYQPERQASSGTAMFRYNKANRYEAENVIVQIPEHALYDDLHFSYAQGARPEGGYSLVQHVHNNLMPPLFSSYELQVRPDSSLPEHLHAKALLVDARGSSIGGTYRDGLVVAQTRNFGSFHVRVDTVAPRIQAVNIAEGRNMANQSRINFKISDDLSGIASFNAYINGEWALMEYDPKTRSLWHVLDPGMAKGRHRLRLEVRDGKGNESVYEASFVR